MEDQPKADVSELQEIDLQNIKDFGYSNNLPDEKKELPKWYTMPGFIEDDNLGF